MPMIAADVESAPYAHKVSCWSCDAAPGETCRNQRGEPITTGVKFTGMDGARYGTHEGRQRHYRDALKSKVSRWELQTDDPQFRLVRGDVLFGVLCHWDHDMVEVVRVEVVRVESDNYDPSCLVRRKDLMLLNFTDQTHRDAVRGDRKAR